MLARLRNLVTPKDTAPNSASSWDQLWSQEGQESWRKPVMSPVYDRIEALLPPGAKVVDIGGGLGFLATRLQKKHEVEVWDISPFAVKEVCRRGIKGRVVDLEKGCPNIPFGTWVVATEVIEHLTAAARERLFSRIQNAGGNAILSVPNDRLGPDEEPQHTIRWTAIEFRKYITDRLGYTRVEVLGNLAEPHRDPAFLMAVTGRPAPEASVALTLPVRDEGKDLGRVLASFRGFVDEIVVGIDPRTKDNTEAVAKRYADKVFFLQDPEGPLANAVYEGPRSQKMAAANEPRMPDGGVHFAWLRNQCLDECTSEWIFMTEGHETLAEGGDKLLRLNQLPEAAKIVMVWRSDARNQRWGFPWLHRNDSKILYERATHNSLDFPPGYLTVKLPGVRTLHERDHSRSVERAAQRKVQNRIALMDDWLTRGSEYSKYYLASEWREFSEAKAINHFQDLLAMKSHNGPMRYQARLILAKLLAREEKWDDARQVLLQCHVDDWSRTEHWIWLGDIAAKDERWEEALSFYLYGASKIGDPPFTGWWIDMGFYTYLPAQRLASAYATLGDVESSLRWALVVRDQIPTGAPQAFRDEIESNIEQLTSIRKEPNHGSAS